MLKIDLHIHTSEDPVDKGLIKHSAKQVIEKAKEKNFNVISITNHQHVTYSAELADFAKRKGILLVPGGEASIHGHHVLVYNITQKELDELTTFKALKNLRERRGNDILVIAPHPLYPASISLGKKFINNHHLFDAVELSHYYTKYIDFNKKAKRLAKAFNLPIVGNSDTHMLWQLGKTYSLIDCEPSIEKIFSHIRRNKIEIKTKPLKPHQFSAVTLYTLYTMAINNIHESGKKRYYVKNHQHNH